MITRYFLIRLIQLILSCIRSENRYGLDQCTVRVVFFYFLCKIEERPIRVFRNLALMYFLLPVSGTHLHGRNWPFGLGTRCDWTASKLCLPPEERFHSHRPNLILQIRHTIVALLKVTLAWKIGDPGGVLDGGGADRHWKDIWRGGGRGLCEEKEHFLIFLFSDKELNLMGTNLRHSCVFTRTGWIPPVRCPVVLYVI